MGSQLGYTREEVIGRKSTDFLTPESSARAQNSVLPDFFKRGYMEDVEYQMVTRTGEVLDVLMSAILERDEMGRPLRSMAVTQDVTARRRAERALFEERQRLAYLVEGTHAGTWEWNVQTGETRFNEQWAQIVGYRLDELDDVSMQAWYDRAHPVDLERSEEILKRHYARELPAYECEVRLRHRGGHWVWVLSRGRVQTWTEDGKPEWMFGVDIETTALKDQQEALRKSRAELAEQHELLRVTLQSIADAVITTDSAGRVVWLNPVAERMTGWSNPDAHDQPLAGVFHLVDEATRQPVACDLPHYGLKKSL